VAGRPPQAHPPNGSQRPDGQRERLVAAVSRAAAEHGYAGLTIARVVDYAGVDRDVFDAHFDSREQGLLAAQEAFLERLLGEATGACEGPAPWPHRLRAGLRAVLSSLIESAALARVLTVEADAAGLPLMERRLAALDDFANLVRRGREHHPAARPLPEVTERLLVGGVASLLRQRLLREEPTATAPLEAELVELLLIPYLGRQEARRIAQEPPGP
jgi:AcrR family transcriptional regulator